MHHHTHRHDDIITVLRLAKEFNLRVVLHHVSDGWKVADEIAAAKVPCSVIVIDSPGGKLEARDASFKTGGVLEKAGVRDRAFTPTTGSPTRGCFAAVPPWPCGPACRATRRSRP